MFGFNSNLQVSSSESRSVLDIEQLVHSTRVATFYLTIVSTNAYVNN